MQRDILSFFPGEPRDVQVEALLALEELWPSHNVFVLNLPVAAGKSKIALTIARWQGQTNILVPNNLLLDQYEQDSPETLTLHRRDHYECEPYHTNCYVGQAKHKCYKCDTSQCPYSRAVARAHKSSTGIFNFHTYLAHKLYKKNLVIDEAHLMVGMLQELASKKLWQRDYHWPLDIRTLGDVLRWVEGLPRSQVEGDKKLIKLKKELLSMQPSTMIHKEMSSWRGKDGHNLLKLIPLDVRNEPPIMWPFRTVQKVVLMSATVGRPDIELMGLGNKKVAYIYGGSPIPVPQRPFDFTPVGNMSYAQQDRSTPLVVDRLLELADKHEGEKGLVHAPYALMRKLQQTELGDDPRFLWHTKEDKAAVYEEFRAMDPSDGAVLMGSGMYEGLDLPYDLGRWQAILKVPFPSLADAGVRAMMERNPEWYAYESIKILTQAYGRICRTPTDFGHTYMLDSAFGRLLEQHDSLFPPWIREAMLDRREKILYSENNTEEDE